MLKKLALCIVILCLVIFQRSTLKALATENDIEVPTIPSNVNILLNSADSIALSWDAADDNVGVVGYDIYVNNFLSLSITETSCTIPNLLPASKYRIAVRAKDAAGNISDEVIIEGSTSSLTKIVWPSANAQVNGPINIIGTASDKDITSWVLDYGTGENPSSWIQIAMGTTSIRSKGLGLLDTTELEDGLYTIRLSTTDKNEIVTADSVVISKNDSLPIVLITSPVYATGVKNNISITGSISDDNLSSWTLEYEIGEDPLTKTLISSGNSSVDDNELGVWETSNLAEGSYTLLASAQDLDGNEVQVSTRVLLDTTLPIANLVSPIDGEFVKGTVSIEGTVNDIHLNNWVLDYGEGDTPTTYTEISTGTDFIIDDSLGELASASMLSDTKYSIRLRVWDDSGNCSTTCAAITKDSQDPIAEITTPVNNEMLSSSIDICGSASDVNIKSWKLLYGIGLDPATWIEISSGSESITNGLLSSWDVSQLAVETYTVKLVVTDKASSTAEASIHVKRNDHKPTVSISSPSANSTINNSYTIVGTVKSEDSFEWHLEYGIGTAPTSWMQVQSGTSSVEDNALGSWDVTGLEDGDYTLKLSAASIGSSAETTVLVHIKKVIATISTPSDNVKTNGVVRIIGTACDASISSWTLEYGEGEDPTSWTMVTSGQSSVSNDLIGDWDTSSLTDGIYTLKLSVIDSDTTVISRVHVTKDSTLPNVSLAVESHVRLNGVVPIIGSINCQGALNWVLEYADGNASTEWHLVSSGSSAVANTFLGNWDTSTLSDGSYVLRLSAADAERPGDKVQRYVDVVKDSTIPVAIIRSPESNSYCNGDLIEISGTVADDNLDRWSLEYTLEDTPTENDWMPIQSGDTLLTDAVLASWDISSLYIYDADCHIRLAVTDRSGNCTYSNVSFVIDHDWPSAYISIPDSSSIVNGVVPVRGIAEDKNFNNWELYYCSDESPENWTLLYDSNSELAYTYPYFIYGEFGKWDTTNLEDGSYWLRLLVYDKAGNIGESRVRITTDSDVPETNITSPVNGCNVTGNIPIKGTVVDNNIKEWTLEVGQGTYSVSDWTQISCGTGNVEGENALGYWDTSTLDYGSYTLRLSAVDNDGNSSISTTCVIIDGPPKVVDISIKDESLLGDYFQYIGGRFMCSNNMNWLIEYGIGQNPSEWISLNSGSSPYFWADWDISDYADGAYSVRITATDTLSNTTQLVYHLYKDKQCPKYLYINPWRKSINIEWTMVQSVDVDSYEIDINGNIITNISPECSNYFCEGIGSNKNYSIRIRSKLISGEYSHWSNYESGELPSISTIYSGDLSKDMNLDIGNSPYIIYSSTIIPENVTISIDPGVVILFERNYGYYTDKYHFSINVEGKLLVNGTVDKPVVFTSNSDPDFSSSGSTLSYWSGILVSDTGIFSAENLHISYSGGLYGRYGWGQSSAVESKGTLQLDHCAFSNIFANGIELNTITPKNVKITNTEIKNCGKNNLKIESFNGGNLDFTNNNITNDDEDRSRTKLNDGNNPISICISNFNPNTLLGLTGYKNVGLTYSNQSDFRNDGIISISNDITLPINQYDLHYNKIVVQEGKTLTLQPGTIFLASPYIPWDHIGYARQTPIITMHGHLVATGLEDSPILITSIFDPIYGTEDIAGWFYQIPDIGKICITNTGSLAGKCLIVEYSGIEDSGTLSLESCQISNCSYRGIDIIGANNCDISVVSCVILDNNVGISIDAKNCNIHLVDNVINRNYYGIYIPNLRGGSIHGINNSIGIAYFNSLLLVSFYPTVCEGLDGYSNAALYLEPLEEDCTLPANEYKMLNSTSLVIMEGKTLTLLPGTIIQFCSMYNEANVNVKGKLNAIGTLEKPIVLTALGDSWENWWSGINVASTGEMNAQYVKMRFAGKCDSWWSYPTDTIKNSGKLSFINSVIAYSCGGGIYNSSLLPCEIRNCIFSHNSGYSVYCADGTSVDARYNYWGTRNGPSTLSHTTDGSRIGLNVSYSPYYGSDWSNQTQFGRTGTYGPSRNYSQQFNDLSSKNSLSSFNLTRTYNSKDDRKNTLFGRGWTFNYEGSVANAQSTVVQEDGTTSVIDIPDQKAVRAPNGAVYQFTVNTDGTYTSLDSKAVKLVKNADNTYSLTTNDQTQASYNADGTLHSITDKYGNTDAVNYVNNKISSIVDSAGHVYNLNYTSNLVANITDISGNRVVSYEYENGNLVRVKNPTGSITRYSYDSAGFLTTIRDNDGHLIESVVYNHNDGEDKDKISQTTDAQGNTLTYSYDNFSKTVTTVDANDRATVQWYDDSLYVTKTLDPENGISTTEYNLTSGSNRYGEVAAQTDRNGNKTSFLWDANGNNTQITNPDSSHKIMAYDDKNNLISQEDESGKKTYYIYDPSKVFLLKKVQPLNGTSAYAGSDDQFAVTNFAYYSEAERIALGYGVKGLVKTVTDPQGGVTAFTYDANGNYKTKNNPLNKETTYTYNPMGWLQQEVSPSGYHTAYTYDANGVQLKKVLDGGETYRTVHDAEGRVIKEILPKLYNSALDNIASDSYSGDCGTRFTYYASGKVQSQTDAEGNTTGYTYDNYGNVLTETKPNGAVYRYEYDKLDRAIKAYYKETAAASEVLLEEYTYSILSNHNTKTVEKKYIDATASVSTAITYDYAGRLIQTQNPDSTVTSTLYNANGTIAQTTDANAKTTYFSYDGLNRLTDKWAPFEQGSSAVQYAYTGYTYDKAGRKTQEKTGKATVQINNLPTEFITTSYEYNLDGTLKSKTDSSGSKLEYEYDAGGLLSLQKDYSDAAYFNKTEYENNHWGKPVTKKVSVRKGDLSGNDFGSDDVLILQTSYTYDANGNVATETDPKGVATTYGYDNLNRQTSVSQPGIDEHSATVTIATSQAYDSMGNVVSKTDANGNVTTYVFDGRGFLLKTVDTLNGVALNSYDQLGRLLAAVTPLNYRDGQPLSSMNRTEYAYDPMGRVKTVSQVYYNTATSQWVSYVNKASKYDANGNVIKVLDSLGYAAGTGSSVDEKINSGYGTESTYNYANLLLTTLTPVSKSQSLSFTTKYAYDAAGRKVSETGANNAISLYTYDDAGNLLLTKVKKNQAAPEVTVQTKTYDKLGHALTQTDGNGNTVSYAYNALGKVSAVIYPHDSTIAEYIVYSQYDKLGNLARTFDNNNTEELFTYDNQGRQLSDKKQHSGGTDAITTHVAFDKGGNKRFVTDGNGNVTENVYDALNRITQTKIEVSGIEQATAYTYDASGNLLTTIDWLGNVTTNEYDPLNRVIVKKDAYGNAVEKLQYNNNDAQISSTDSLNNVTQYTYDRNNRLLTTTDSGNHVSGKTYDYAGNVGSEYDGKSNTTWYDYDEYNRLIKVTNPKGEQTVYTYDLNGNKLTQTDGKGNTKTFEYNVINMLVRSIDVGGRTGTAGSYVYDPTRTVSYSYDKNGDLHAMTDRNGVTTTYTYDSHGRMLTQQAGTSTISFTYDGNGNQLTMTDATGTTARTYDALNRTLTKSVPVIGTATYVYNLTAGQPAGTVAEQSTDPAGNVVVKAYDKASRLHSVTDGTDVTLYEYYDNGAKQSVTYSSGAKEEYTYLEGKLLSGLINRRPDGSVMDSYSYAYDAAHNQTSKTETINGVQKGTTSYTYDSLNRLLTVLEPSSRITVYGYDAAGNRSTETITVGTTINTKTYAYDPQNRLTGLEEKCNDVTQFLWAYGYDNNGNLLSTRKTTYVSGEPQMPYAETANTYDSWNQLIQTVAQGSTVENTYNGEGLRVAKSVNGSETRYFYEYTNIVLETNDGGIETARNVFGTNLIKRVIGTAAYNYFYNGHADVTALVDVTSGSISAAYYYDAFGVVLESSGTVNNSILYAGYQYDKETGYYYLNARMYDPAIARFLQEDTYLGKQNDPLSLNLYAYVKNNPLIYSDPTGHREMKMASWDEEVKNPRSALGDYKRYSAKKKERSGSQEVTISTVLSNYKDGFTGFFTNQWDQVSHAVSERFEEYKQDPMGSTWGHSWPSLIPGYSAYITVKTGYDILKSNVNTYVDMYSTLATLDGNKIAKWWGGYHAEALEQLALIAVTDGAGRLATKGVSAEVATAGRVGAEGAGGSEVGSAIGRKPDFYVTPSGEAVPSTGYRYMSRDAGYMDDLRKTMNIPENPNGTYITFDKFDIPAPNKLQVPHDASMRGSFDMLQIIDDLRIPNGKWGQAEWLEPFTKDYPKFGHGGATQAVTNRQIKLDELKDLLK